jgi:outer membrane protein TolC
MEQPMTSLKKILLGIFFAAFIATVQAQDGAPAPGQPLTLDDAIKTTLQNNPALQAAGLGAKSAQWGVKKAYLDYLPQVNFGFQYVRLDNGTLDRANAFYNFVNDPANAAFLPEELRRNVRPGAWANSYGPSVSVVQPVYTGGILRAQLGVAQAADVRSQANLEETRQQVIFETQGAYLQALKAMELVALAQEAHRSAQEHLQTTQKMLEVGMRARNEVLRFEVALANAENNLVVAQNNFELLKAALNKVMGVNIERAFTLTPVEDFSWEAPRTLQEQTEIALRRHPGLQVMKSTVSLQHAAVGVARSGFMPKVNLAYNYSWEANDTWAFDSYKTWSLAVVANIPVFNSFQNYAGLRKEQEALGQVKKLEDEFVRGLQLQVKQASLNLGAAEKRTAISEKAVEEANENLRIVKNSYEVGLLSSLDVVDAEVAATLAKASRIEARYDFFIAKAQLARAMGVLGR